MDIKALLIQSCCTDFDFEKSKIQSLWYNENQKAVDNTHRNKELVSFDFNLVLLHRSRVLVIQSIPLLLHYKILNTSDNNNIGNKFPIFGNHN